MDFHKLENITLKDVVKAHMADLAIQEKYGVKYHQFWVNEKAGTVFCLTEGPDAETCEMVHKMAHGNLACAITEVQSGDYQKIMGLTRPDDDGVVRNEDKTLDLGYRTILVAYMRGIAEQSGAKGDKPLTIPKEAKKHVLDRIGSFNGREIEWPIGDCLIAVFNEAADAVKCSHEIQRDFQDGFSAASVVVRIGISADQPVTHDGTFFTQAIKRAQQLSDAADDNRTLISALATKLCRESIPPSSQLRYLNEADEHFLTQLLDLAEQNLSDAAYSIDQLCKDLGISRPQLYRKMTTLTGRAPNNFLRDIRMDKAVNLLKRKMGNISQVALEVGYSNPSYFSKCFTEKFGCMPSEVTHGQSA